MKWFICLFKGHKWKRTVDTAYDEIGPSRETVYIPTWKCDRCGATMEAD